MIETHAASNRELLADQSVRQLLSLFEDVLNSKMDRFGAALTDRIAEKVGVSSEALGMIRLLAARSNQPKEDVIEKALTLYAAALDAVAEGNRLAVIDSDDMIVNDIIGLDATSDDGDAES